ncbi:MAG: hypothetical protein QG577_2210, partial [Thermodesulfobacteriota bacterium]|nr:hypothetical protein [Thermodesulfobacteriota bacterium]
MKDAENTIKGIPLIITGTNTGGEKMDE